MQAKIETERIIIEKIRIETEKIQEKERIEKEEMQVKPLGEIIRKERINAEKNTS